MDKKYVIGIDPGFSGGICILDTKGNIVEVFLMPTLKLKSKTGTKLEYDLRKIAGLFELYPPKMVGLEIQQAFPGQGSVSMFKIGRGFGLLEGMLVGLKAPYTLIKPRSWQSKMFEGQPPDDSKSLSKMVAQRIWPNTDFRKTPRCSDCHDGLTDASLMAEYIRRELI